MTLLLLDFNYVYLFVLHSLKQKRCGGRSFVEAWISNMMEWNFCSNSIFEINLTLLWYKILEKLVTFITKEHIAVARLKDVNLSCFEVSEDNGSFIPTFKYYDAHQF